MNTLYMQQCKFKQSERLKGLENIQSLRNYIKF